MRMPQRQRADFLVCHYRSVLVVPEQVHKLLSSKLYCCKLDSHYSLVDRQCHYNVRRQDKSLQQRDRQLRKGHMVCL